MQDPYLNSVLEAIARDALDGEGPRLITVDELRAAGALDVPASWRKSLGEDCDNDENALPLFAAPSGAVSNDTRPAAEGRSGGPTGW